MAVPHKTTNEWTLWVVAGSCAFHAAEEFLTGWQEWARPTLGIVMRTDLEWVFTVQTERVVSKDNTVAIGARCWQIEKVKFRHSLAGCTVTIHEHLDGTVSLRYGPHVVGRFDAAGKELKAVGKDQQRRTAKAAASGVGV